MTPGEFSYAEKLLAWSRTIEDHGLSFDEWRKKEGDNYNGSVYAADISGGH